VTTLEQVQDPAVLHAITQYARYGDPGALRYLRANPFASWMGRVERNIAALEEVDEPEIQDPPEELVEELRTALARLHPAERQALKDALSNPSE
jgi:DNA-directed RNA polymerase specialized sigma24 family protein